MAAPGTGANRSQSPSPGSAPGLAGGFVRIRARVVNSARNTPEPVSLRIAICSTVGGWRPKWSRQSACAIPKLGPWERCDRSCDQDLVAGRWWFPVSRFPVYRTPVPSLSDSLCVGRSFAGWQQNLQGRTASTNHPTPTEGETCRVFGDPVKWHPSEPCPNFGDFRYRLPGRSLDAQRPR